MFDDPSTISKGLPSPGISADDCKKPEPQQPPDLPPDYQRFARAAYCSYVIELNEINNAASDGKQDADDHTRLGKPGELRQAWLKQFIEEGLQLGDYNCRSFFNGTEGHRVKTEFFQGSLNAVISGITASILQLNSHTRAAANLATGLTVGNAVISSYKSNYLISPTLGRLYEKLEKEVFTGVRHDIREFANGGRYTTFASAKRDLVAYEDLCSHKELIKALEKATDAVRYESEVAGCRPSSSNEQHKSRKSWVARPHHCLPRT